MESPKLIPLAALLVAAALSVWSPPAAHGYARRLRTPLLQEPYLVETLTPVDKRNFESLRCRGVYRTAIFTQLDAVCDDCYQLYKEPEIHAICRSVGLGGLSRQLSHTSMFSAKVDQSVYLLRLCRRLSPSTTYNG